MWNYREGIKKEKCLMKSNNMCMEKCGIIEKEWRKRGRRNKVNILI